MDWTQYLVGNSDFVDQFTYRKVEREKGQENEQSSWINSFCSFGCFIFPHSKLFFLLTSDCCIGDVSFKHLIIFCLRDLIYSFSLVTRTPLKESHFPSILLPISAQMLQRSSQFVSIILSFSPCKSESLK